MHCAHEIATMAAQKWASPEGGETTKTMWHLLERVAELERRVGALYDRFAELFRQSPLIADFWREMAGEERLHAVIVAAAREVFPVTAPAPPGEWSARLAEIEELLSAVESRAVTGLSLADAFACAEQVEASELNAVTESVLRHAGAGFSRLGPFVARSGVDRHRDKVLEARRRFRIAEVSVHP
jgi:hypothetical protein